MCAFNAVCFILYFFFSTNNFSTASKHLDKFLVFFARHFKIVKKYNVGDKHANSKVKYFCIFSNFVALSGGNNLQFCWVVKFSCMYELTKCLLCKAHFCMLNFIFILYFFFISQIHFNISCCFCVFGNTLNFSFSSFLVCL